MSSANISINYEPILSVNNSAFCSYLICVCLLILKMMFVTLLTIYNRMKTKKFISSEDATWMNGEVGSNETIDRIRRVYQNDLEGIPLFFIVSFGYLFTNSPLWLINTVYIIFIIVRYLHTFVYAFEFSPQPTRAILWGIGFIITGYMAIHTALYAFIKLVN